MGSNQQGDFGLGSGRSPSSSSKKKKKNSLEKALRQPQRGLGVAQLEKIRIQSQMMASYNLQLLHHPFLTMEEDMKIPLTFPLSSSSSSPFNGASSSSVFSVHPNSMMGCGDNLVSVDKRFGDLEYTQARFSAQDHEISRIPQIDDHLQAVTHPVLIEDSVLQRRIHQQHGYFAGSLSQVSDSNESQELDLELRL
ncbi:hypothetical protein IEQ34_018120 [Dendrobium chrysotoxum]|uniref:Uncharacterized protein n=1 Tax=Dendrobium chrysotoxum TaxID=161865 RepID=A0AAV7GBG7_DENCH|nr:hypothetical protein IEQ34_018120 [Dendrobium chrysotoxum]